MKQGWEYKKLGEVCTIERGGSPRPITDYITDSEDGINWIKIGDAQEGSKYITSTKEKIRPEGIKKSRFVHKGDFILSNSMSFGRPYILKVDGCIHDGWLVIHDDNEVFIKDYLYYILSSPIMYAKFSQLAVGGVVNNLNSSLVRKVSIPLPPKSTQLTIVSELDKINELIRLKKEQLKDCDNLAQSIFYEMFGDPVENDKGFNTKRLDEVFPLITDGTHQTPTYTEDRENGYKFLSAKDVTSGSINWDNVKYIPVWLHDNLSKRLKPQKNDILLCKNGTTGICALVEDDEIFDIYVSLALLRPNDKHNPKYLTYAINSPATKRQFDDSLKGIGVPNLHLKEIRKTIIIVPPLPLQHLFAQRIEQIERQKSAVQKSITDLETLLASRMQYWFE
ncbi:restriction endonuclease subunit S [uncultured Prevotella sp.]|uniref:restriction endonuclease subunit S n=1 Tax=uncultured Prevotella sp. TaxID=159272 RepID=UPI0025FB8176|nr:restriction endonuclease subunit S [uncultured Prevotella sp.]